MEIQTKLFGVVTVGEQSLITFKEGLYGLEEYKRYILIQPDQELPFAYLQAVNEVEVCLLVADPFAFYPHYEFDLSEQDLQALEHPADNSISVWTTVSANRSLEEATTNLLAPIVLNTDKWLGRQVVLHDSAYQTRMPLIPRKKEGE